MKNPWSDRWSFVKSYIPPDCSIVDFGCGNKEVLDHCRPTKYLGVDRLPTADIVVDLDHPFEISEHFDVGLLLGVLEYSVCPSRLIDNVKHYADTFVILNLIAKKKPEWTCAFTQSSLDELLSNHFASYKKYQHGRYVVSIGKV